MQRRVSPLDRLLRRRAVQSVTSFARTIARITQKRKENKKIQAIITRVRARDARPRDDDIPRRSRASRRRRR